MQAPVGRAAGRSGAMLPALLQVLMHATNVDQASLRAQHQQQPQQHQSEGSDSRTAGSAALSAETLALHNEAVAAAPAALPEPKQPALELVKHEAENMGKAGGAAQQSASSIFAATRVPIGARAASARGAAAGGGGQQAKPVLTATAAGPAVPRVGARSTVGAKAPAAGGAAAAAAATPVAKHRPQQPSGPPSRYQGSGMGHNMYQYRSRTRSRTPPVALSPPSRSRSPKEELTSEESETPPRRQPVDKRPLVQGDRDPTTRTGWLPASGHRGGRK